jgi:hypothetical protein
MLTLAASCGGGPSRVASEKACKWCFHVLLGIRRARKPDLAISPINLTSLTGRNSEETLWLQLRLWDKT